MTEFRLVLDTNAWISRLLLPGSVTAQAVDRALSLGQVLVSEPTLEELSGVLARPKFDPYVSRSDRQEFIRQLAGIVEIVPILRHIQACRDPRDDCFLELAVNGRASHIIRGDKDLLVLDPFMQVRILSPSGFLAISDSHMDLRGK
ncbi:MAG: putative toxin-antitoxin system toxin component, PIN family [Sulfuricella denitrificans]|nr:putative toxin-antitoxin system toxin component, PIN family [Sulfuricella denitrificans]